METPLFLNKSYLLGILKKYNYAVENESDIPDEMYQLFCEKISEQMKEALRVALVSADNEKRTQLLSPKDIEAIRTQLKVFK